MFLPLEALNKDNRKHKRRWVSMVKHASKKDVAPKGAVALAELLEAGKVRKII